jgi:hypothetical protein
MKHIAKLEPIDYLVIGHITRDLTPDGPTMGGTASYSALTAKAIGVKVGVVTSWGSDIPLGPMEKIPIINHPSETSTTFENLYTSNGRMQIIHNFAKPLPNSSIPNNWYNTPIIHLGPIAGEIAPGMVELFPNSMIGVTPQGWLRTWDDEGHVIITEWQESKQILNCSQVGIISIKDVSGNEKTIDGMAANCPIFVVTEGYLGSRVYWHGDVRRFNAPKVDEIDSTGAGDIFAAAFFIQYNKTANAWEAARFATQLAARSVTRRGVSSVPTGDEVKGAMSEVF